MRHSFSINKLLLCFGLLLLLGARASGSTCPNLVIGKPKKITLDPKEICKASQMLNDSFGVQVIVHVVQRYFSNDDKWYAYLDSIEPLLTTADGYAARMPNGNYYDNVLIIAIGEVKEKGGPMISIAYGKMVGDLVTVDKLKSIKKKMSDEIISRGKKKFGMYGYVINYALKEAYSQMKDQELERIETAIREENWRIERERIQNEQARMALKRDRAVMYGLGFIALIIAFFVLRRVYKKHRSKMLAALERRKKVETLWLAVSNLITGCDSMLGGRERNECELYRTWLLYYGDRQPELHQNFTIKLDSLSKDYQSAFNIFETLSSKYSGGIHTISEEDLGILERLYLTLISCEAQSADEIDILLDPAKMPTLISEKDKTLITQANNLNKYLAENDWYNAPFEVLKDKYHLKGVGLMDNLKELKEDVGKLIHTVNRVMAMQKALESGLPKYLSNYNGVDIAGFEPETLKTFIHKITAQINTLLANYKYPDCESWLMATNEMFVYGYWETAFKITASNVGKAQAIHDGGIKYLNAQEPLDIVQKSREQAKEELKLAQHPQLVLTCLLDMARAALRAAELMQARLDIKSSFMTEWVEIHETVAKNDFWQLPDVIALETKVNVYPAAEKQYILTPLLKAPSQEACLEQLEKAKELYRHEQQYYEEAWALLCEVRDAYQPEGVAKQAYKLLNELIGAEEACYESIKASVALANTTATKYTDASFILGAKRIQLAIDDTLVHLKHKEIFLAQKAVAKIEKDMAQLIDEAKATAQAYSTIAAYSAKSYGSSSSSSYSSSSSSSRSSGSSSSGSSSRGSSSSSSGSSGYSGGGRSSSGSSGGGRSSGSSSSGGGRSSGGGYSGGGRV